MVDITQQVFFVLFKLKNGECTKKKIVLDIRNSFVVSELTVRRKIDELVELGVLVCVRNGRDCVVGFDLVKAVHFLRGHLDPWRILYDEFYKRHWLDLPLKENIKK